MNFVYENPTTYFLRLWEWLENATYLRPTNLLLANKPNDIQTVQQRIASYSGF
jgi:hypothetical protein